MPGYLSETAFVGKLSFDIIMWIVILFITFYCIRRNPTDYDTNYRKRNRMIFGSLCFLAAMGFLFWGFMLPEDFAIRNYFLSTFGTYTPNETMIQLGMSPTVSPRAVGVTPIFALPTYEQWLILQKINSFAVTFALGIIFFFFKKSSTRTLAKVRKVCGYIFLIFLVPAALNIHLYFDLEEFIVTIPIYIITWLLLRTYRKDFVEPTLPVESVQHGDNKDFAPIKPEMRADVTLEPSQPKYNSKNYLFSSLKDLRDKMKYTPSTSKLSIIICSVLGGIFFILSMITSCIYGLNIYKEREYKYNDTYDVWLRDYGCDWMMSRYADIDTSLGIPILGNNSLCLNSYNKYSNVLYGFRTTLPQYYHLLSYEITDSATFLISQFERLNTEGYYPQIEINREGDQQSTEMIYWDKYITKYYNYGYGGGTYSSNKWYRKHIIKICRNKAYELVAHVPDINLYDDSLEYKIYSLEDPKIKLNIELLTILIWGSISITIIIGILLLLLLCNNIKCSKTKNERAVILFKYQMISTIIEFVIVNVLIIFDVFYLDIEEHILINSIYTITFLLRITLIIQAYKKTNILDDTYYLIPQKIKNLVNRYSASEAPLRALLVFIIFPLYYLLTLPGGFFFLLYIIPAVIVYTLVFFIQWIIKGTKESL